MLPVANFGVGYIKSQIAKRVKEKRLANDFSRKTLSERSSVSESSIKRMETIGETSLDNLVKISIALGCAEDFNYLFVPGKIIRSFDELSNKERKRGRK
jgi:transcriptional regulator with XRE-family HTH domain